MDDTSSTISEGDPDYKYILDILYGPTVVCGIVKYRTGRIYHIKEKLEERGFEVNLRRFSICGMVAFAFEGQTVFMCAAKNLSFSGCSSDPAANRAIRKLLAERRYADSPKTPRPSVVAAAAADSVTAEKDGGGGATETSPPRQVTVDGAAINRHSNPR